MTKNTIKYPEIRNEICQSIKFLADKDIKKWAKSKYPHALWDNLRYPIGNLLDDLDLDSNAEDQIGSTLYNSQECKVVKSVSTQLNNLIQEVGGRQPDEAYLNWDSWDELVKAAEEALKLLSENNHKYNFIYKDL